MLCLGLGGAKNKHIFPLSARLHGGDGGGSGDGDGGGGGDDLVGELQGALVRSLGCAKPEAQVRLL